MRPHRRGAVQLAVGLLAATAGAWWAASLQQRERGRAIFDGSLPVEARLVGHEQVLPAAARLCANCHASRDKPLPGPALATAASGPARNFAVALDGRRLTQAVSRRGGPASVFDAASLCRLLRVGIDPAQVMVPTIMPRYVLSDPQCADLWAYLATR